MRVAFDMKLWALFLENYMAQPGKIRPSASHCQNLQCPISEVKILFLPFSAIARIRSNRKTRLITIEKEEGAWNASFIFFSVNCSWTLGNYSHVSKSGTHTLADDTASPCLRLTLGFWQRNVFVYPLSWPLFQN